MTLPFMKARSSDSGYIVVNMADTSATDVREMARRLCQPPLGVGADGLAVVRHLERVRFTVRCLQPDGTGSPPDGRVLRCCARVIEIRYGYQSATLVTGGSSYESRVAGQDIGLRFPSSRDTDGLCDVPQRGVYRNWAGAVNVATFLGGIGESDAAAASAKPKQARSQADGAIAGPVECRSLADLRMRDDDPIEDAVGPPGHSEAHSAAVFASWLGGRVGDRIEPETRRESSFRGQDGRGMDQETWLYGPAMLLFEGEFPWP
jgi:hypothetical protein